MVKNEDYMKKALMRGVCALNMEAMSIFNDTIIGNKTHSQTGSTGSMDNLMEAQAQTQGQLAAAAEPNGKSSCQPSSKPYHVTYCPAYHRNEVSESQSTTSDSSGVGDKCRADRELARRVKNYCEKSLSNKAQSAVSKGEAKALYLFYS